jgi:hypothetical protein
MKVFFIIACLAISTVVISQETATTESGKKVILNKDGTWKYAPESHSKTLGSNTFTKLISDNNARYYLSDMVTIENGKEEEVPVKFNASIPKDAWDDLVKKYGMVESEYFALMARSLSLNAQYSLKNTLSFEPFTKQFFSLNDGVFVSDYKMVGKNGYGNAVETSVLVKYDPKELKSNYRPAPSVPTIKN